ncbi:MAG: hypothetical protein ACOCVF_01215 [bacterium]
MKHLNYFKNIALGMIGIALISFLDQILDTINPEHNNFFLYFITIFWVLYINFKMEYEYRKDEKLKEKK